MTTKILKKSDADAAPVGQQIAALLAGLSSAELDALGTAVRARADSVYQPRGTQAQLTAFLATLAHGTEYVWTLTDGAGTLLDILSGVA